MIEIFTVGLGTYLLRYIPMNVRMNVDKEKLEDVTAAVISALFVTSFVKLPLGGMLLDGASLILAATAYKATRNMGIAILIATLLNAVLRLLLNI